MQKVCPGTDYYAKFASSGIICGCNMTKGKVLAIDYGSRKIGVATGDLEMKVAFPRMIIENKGFEFVSGEVLRICDELQVKIVVIGLPLRVKAEEEENFIMKLLKKFVNKIKPLLKQKGIDLALLDERFSTFEAQQVMEKYNLKGENDMLAAQVILQRFFDTV